LLLSKRLGLFQNAPPAGQSGEKQAATLGSILSQGMKTGQNYVSLPEEVTSPHAAHMPLRGAVRNENFTAKAQRTPRELKIF
jgi:hypothetical protein